jgi:hypothetical protein
MAVTINSGMVATDDPLSNDLAVSMSEKVAMLDVDNTQFTTRLMKLPEQTASSFKEEWMDDQLLPTNTALSATAASGDTNLALTTNEGSYWKVGDIGKFVQTGEAFRVTAVAASALTVVRAIGSVAAATAASGTGNGGIIRIVGSNEQGGTLPTALVTQKVANYNYCGIVRNSYRYTETASWVRWYSGKPLAYARRKVGIEHKREIEQSLFFGARSYTAGTNAPRCTSGGLDEYISTNITTVNGTLDKGAFNDFLRSGLEYGERSRKVLFASPIIAQVLSEFLQDNWVRATPSDNVWGVNVQFVISGVHGTKIPVFVKNDWKRFGEAANTAAIGTRAYLVDMTNVELLRAPSSPKGPRFASLYTKREANDADESAEEFLSEYTLRVSNETAHANLRGVTG